MNLEQQVDEIELLQSMYSSPGEFQFHDQAAYEQAVSYTRELCAEPPGTVSVKVFILINTHHDPAPTEETACGRPVLSGSTARAEEYRLEIFFRLSNRSVQTEIIAFTL